MPSISRRAPRPRPTTAALLALAVLAAACGGDTTTPTPGVDAVELSAPVDSVLAVGSTVQLQAQPVDAAGDPVAADVVWSSSDPDVALVDATGRMAVLAPGTTRIQAEAENAIAHLDFRAVEVDRAAVRAPLEDPLTAHLVTGLGPTASNVTGFLAAAGEALDDGDVLAVRDDLEAVADAAATTTAPDDQAILAVLVLMTDHALRALGF